MIKKEYVSPELTFVRIWVQDTVLASGPEDFSSQINSGGDWGDGEEEEIID